MIEPDINERMARFAPSQRGSFMRRIMEGSSVPEQQDVEYPSMPDYTGAKIAEDVAAMGELSEPAAPVRPVQSSPIAEDIAEQARQNLNASLVGVRTVNPDEAAKAMRLGRQLDLPPEVVRADMRRAEEQEYLDRLRSRDILRNDPVLANYLANREFANIAHDDIDNLTAIERTFKFFRDIPSGVSEGFTKAVSQAEMTDIIERQRQRGGYLEEYEKAALQSYNRELAALSVETGLAEAGSYLFSQQLAGWKQEDIDIILAGGVIGGGAGLAGGPLAPATVPAGIALGLKAGLSTALVNRSLRMERALLYAELEPELGNDLANQIATGAGVVNAALDVGALGLITKPLREPFKAAFRQSVKEAVKKQTVRQAFGRFGLWYAGSAATEVGTETLQELNNVLAMELGLYLQDKPLVLATEEGRAEVADRLANIAAETALGMVTVGLPGPAFQFYADVRGAAKATRDHKVLENIAKTVAESKVLPRDAKTMEQYLASTAAGTDAETTYIDAAVAHDILRQSGLTELEMDAVLPGVRQQIEQYQSDGITLVGADVTIPTAQFAARLAKTPLQSQLLPHARLSADAPSLVEAQRIRAEHDQRRAEAEQIIAQQEATNGTFVQEAREIEDTLASQIQATGQMDERAARSSAQFMRDFYVTQAASMGLTPKQVYERFPVRVEGEGMAAPLAQASRIDTDYTAAVERGDMATAQRETDLAAEMAMPQSAVRGDGEIGAAGKLLRVFHGSGAFIRQFMYEFTGQGVDQLGSGFYFTTDRDEAVSYTTRRGQQDLPKLGGEDAPTVVEAYLDIRNPLDASTTGSITVKQVQKFIELAPEESRREGLENWGIEGDKPSTKVLNAYAFTDANIVRELFKIGNDFYGRNTEAFNRAIKQVLGYDGVVQDFRVDGVRKLHYVAFFPEQIKSADPVTRDESGNVVPLSRRFDITSPKLFEQAPVSPGFYSALAKAVDAIDAKSIAPAGWKERIKGLVNKGDVKQDEVDWSGLTDWLDMQEGKVTKEAVAEFLKNNGVRVERVQIGGTELENLRNEHARAEMDYDDALEVERAAQLGTDEAAWNAADARLSEARRRVSVLSARLAETERASTKFSQYTLPGGTNYREVLITLPAVITSRAAEQARYNELVAAGFPLMEAQRIASETAADIQDRQLELQKQQEPYASNVAELVRLVSGNVEGSSPFTMFQWLKDHPNKTEWQPQIDAWIDAVGGNFRAYVENRGWLNDLEAFQNLNSQIEALRAERRIREREQRGFTSGHWDQPNVLVHFRLKDRVNADGKRVLFVEEIQSDWGQAGRKQGFKGDVPLAPFVETTDGWLNLGLKHILLEATQGNYDRVAFVNGSQSADRYDLSKQVEQISWDELTDAGRWNYGAPSATKVVTIRPIRGNLIDIPIDAQGIAVAAGTTGNQFDGKPLDEIVPKEIAEQVMAERSGDIRGDGLKVGGKGMMEFYDKIVPAAVNKLLKKYGGGKLGTVEIDLRTPESEAWYREPTAEELPAQPGFPVTPEMVKKLESGLPLFQAMPAGAPRGGFDPRRLTTILNKTADLSTFLHESAHAFLTFYEQVAQMPDAPARIVNDLDEVLRWAGIAGDTPQARLATWNGMTLDQKRKAHEQFAYSFEVYLFEGKAPSAEMQGLFERFSAWLKRVYRSIRDDLNAIYRREFGEDLPILTGEVRQVMDRMLATDEQIARQAAINEMKPMFQTREEAMAFGMPEAEWAAFQQMQQEAIEASVIDMNVASMRQMQWLGNARSRVLREVQKKHDARRKEVAVEIAAEVKVEPVYRAMTYLRTGKFVDADGAEVAVEGPHRLDTKRVKKLYETVPTAASLEAVRATGMPLPAVIAPDIAKLGTGKNGMMGLDGLDPDLVAETFGYSSGDEMIRALVAARPMKEIVAERTDAEMLRRFGDMNTPEAVEAEVQAALHNEARARMVAVQLRFVSKATEPARVMVDAAKQVARDLIAAKRVRDVRPSDFVAAEARAARDSEYLVKYEAQPKIAGRAEYDRVYNLALSAGSTEEGAITAATAAQEAFVATQRALRAEEFRARFGPTTPQEALIRAQRAQLYQNQLAAEALRVKAEVDKLIKYLRRVLRDENVKRMGADAADQVRAILDNYSLVSMTRAQREQITDLRNWLAAEEANGTLVDIDPSLADSARRKNYTELTVEQFRDLVDSVKLIEYRGKNERNIYLAGQKLVFEEMRDGVVASMTEVAEKKGRKVRKDLGDEDRKWMNTIASYDASQQTIANIVYVLDGGKRDGPLARALIMPANDAGNQEAADRAAVSEKVNDIVGPLAKKGQFAAPKMHFPHIGESLSLEQRMVIALNYGNQSNIDRLLNGEQWTADQARVIIESLTEEQLQAVQAIWDVMSSFRDRVAEKSRRLTGKEPRWLEPLPMSVTSADGRTVELRGGYYPAKYNPRRSVGARELDIAADAERLQREAYTATTTSRSFEKNRSDKPPVDQVLSRQFVAMYAGLNEVIHDLAWHDFAIAATKLLRDKSFQRVIKERYGLETYNSIKDWVDVVVAGDRTKYDAFEQVAIFARQNVSVSAMGIRLMTAAVQPTGIFPAMTRVGIGPMVRAIAEFAYSPVQTSRNVLSRSSFMQSRGRTRFRDLNEIQNIVQEQSRFQRVRRTYIASAYVLTSFTQGLVDTSVWMAAYSNAIKSGKSEKDAVFVADQTVIDTQGSGRVQDLSSAMRGGKKQSAYAKLFTPFYQYSNTMYSLFGAQMRTAPTYGKAAKDALLILTVGAIVEELIRYALKPSQEEPEPEELAKKLAANQIDFVVGLPFGLREFRGAGSLIMGTEDGVQSYRGPSGLRIVTDATQAAVQARQGEFDAAFRRAVINLLGTTAGIPSAQINDTITGIEAVVEGEVEGAEAVLAPVTGVRR